MNSLNMEFAMISSALEGLPHIYYINLDDRKDKNQYMVQLLTGYNLPYTRISATDGKKSVKPFLDGNIPDKLKQTEIACCISHLRAIREWLTTSDTEVAMFCEDDLSLDTVLYWNSTWKQFMKRVPFYWDILQCCITYHPNHPPVMNIHMHQTTDFSCVCYVLHRKYAMKLMDLYWRNETWKLDYDYHVGLTAEELLYRPGACISIPLFTYTNQFLSSIQTKEHMNTYHEYSRKLVLDVWKQKGNHDLLSFYPSIILQKQIL